MFGIFFAALCAFGLYRLWRPRRFGHYGYGWAGGCGPGACGRGFPRHGGWQRGRGPSGLRHLMRGLNATPAQESALRQSAEEIVQALRDKSPWALFKPMAAALTDETFDRDRLSAALRQPGDAASDATLIAAIERLRETLDPDQRKKLAALVNQRFGGGFEL